MPISQRRDGDNAHIALSDRFVYADSSEYRKSLMATLGAKPQAIDIDLSKLTFMDSAGLGMLIVTLNECSEHNVSLRLLHPQGGVQELLRVTKSYDRFRIVD